MATNWKNIIKDLNRQRCIVLLGPKLATFNQGGENVLIEEALAEHIAELLEDNDVEYEASARNNLSYVAQRFLTIPGVRNVDLEDTVYDFLDDNTEEIPIVYTQIAELPVYMVINTTPDTFMLRALRKAGKRPMFSYYNFQLNHNSRRGESSEELDLHNIGTDRPLVYNIFGSLEDPESLVITENHQLDYIRNLVQGNPPIPDTILSQFDRRKSYLFLGFNVENWQYRLFLDTVNMENNSAAVSPKVKGLQTSKVTESFFKDRFGFDFVEDEVEGFVANLHQQMVNPDTVKKYHIYISYAHNDEHLLEGLTKAFIPQETRGLITVWHKGLLMAGESQNEAIQKNIEKADVVLLLVSADLLADDEVMDVEMQWISARKKSRDVKVIPVVGRACDWQSHPDFSELLPLPEDGTPIESGSSRWRSNDDAYLEIVRQLSNQLK